MTLLSPNYEKLIKKEKIYRILSSFLFLLTLITVVGLVFMLPSYFNVVLSKDEIFRRLKTAEEVLARRESGKLEAETSNINKIIADYISNEKKRHSLSDLLVGIFKVTPLEIKIESMDLKKDKEGQFIIDVSGVASTRDGFLSYISALQKLPSIEQVKSPISNLLEESNAKFRLELKIKKEVYKI